MTQEQSQIRRATLDDIAAVEQISQHNSIRVFDPIEQLPNPLFLVYIKNQEVVGYAIGLRSKVHEVMPLIQMDRTKVATGSGYARELYDELGKLSYDKLVNTQSNRMHRRYLMLDY